MHNQILVVYTEIPENQFFFLIPANTLDDATVTLITEAHGKVVNCDDLTPGMQYLMNALQSPEYKREGDAETFGELYRHKLDAETTPSTQVPFTFTELVTVVQFSFVL